ncbi:ASCH domain-containing protein [Brevibacterium sp. 91QC2O2]|uniref:ASCH domain-containing protein n=1 Tax=Brevibacterium TaxID=1696 RepID=UPI00211CCE85|nr:MULTISPECIES: ASCH domain-containing protein [unclassified Brevibacterium]MCQ9366779.1 ASCH domain-containing protein [Brevibacterium sp. 91QC2O2]MCQ9384249.1 ASCH domain-containing protein [Brevibacterium sp. 68QC2CO]
MISDELRHLVRLTGEHAARWNDDYDHTVAAGLLTASGQVVLGLNTYHFLGGPCGEIAALSNHASSVPTDPIVAVTAVYGSTGDVISPCGKCRQVIFDMDPRIRFVVRDANGLTTRTAAELLPLAYDWRAVDQPQKLYMWEGYEGPIRSGSKTQTIRIDDPFRPGSAELVFEKEDGEVVVIPATITDVRTIARDEATEDIAIKDGFTCLEDLHTALESHYPGLGTTDPVDIVTFALDGD